MVFPILLGGGTATQHIGFDSGDATRSGRTTVAALSRSVTERGRAVARLDGSCGPSVRWVGTFIPCRCPEKILGVQGAKPPAYLPNPHTRRSLRGQASPSPFTPSGGGGAWSAFVAMNHCQRCGGFLVLDACERDGTLCCVSCGRFSNTPEPEPILTRDRPGPRPGVAASRRRPPEPGPRLPGFMWPDMAEGGG